MSPKLENPMTFVRSIKGAPASVLFALMFVRRPMSSQELQTWTGYKDDNITIATRLLCELGWVVAIGKRGPWGLADDGRQLPLMPSFGLENESDLIGFDPTTTTYGRGNAFILESGSSSKDLKAPSPIKSGSRSNPFYSENMKACRNGGIGEPKASQISNGFNSLGEAIRPEYIAAHIASLADGETVGLAIHRIENDELPRSWEWEIKNPETWRPGRQSDDEIDGNFPADIVSVPCLHPFYSDYIFPPSHPHAGKYKIDHRCSAPSVQGEKYCVDHIDDKDLEEE